MINEVPTIQQILTTASSESSNGKGSKTQVQNPLLHFVRLYIKKLFYRICLMNIILYLLEPGNAAIDNNKGKMRAAVI